MSLGNEMIKKKMLGRRRKWGCGRRKVRNGKERSQGTVKEGRRKGANTVEGLASYSLVTVIPALVLPALWPSGEAVTAL